MPSLAAHEAPLGNTSRELECLARATSCVQQQAEGNPVPVEPAGEGTDMGEGM